MTDEQSRATFSEDWCTFTMAECGFFLCYISVRQRWIEVKNTVLFDGGHIYIYVDTTQQTINGVLTNVISYHIIDPNSVTKVDLLCIYVCVSTSNYFILFTSFFMFFFLLFFFAVCTFKTYVIFNPITSLFVNHKPYLVYSYLHLNFY